ncbi:MAG: hypothetical protein RJQ00_09660 [Vicingaceae bacterium]
MKKISLLLLLFLMVFSPVFSQDECNPYLLLTEGRTWTTKSYSAKKDKYQGSQTFKVLSITEEDGKMLVTVNLIATDKKDKEAFNKDITFECENGVVDMDISSMIPAEMIESLESMDMKVEMDRLSIPQKLKVGQKLDDGSITMTMEGPVNITMGFNIKDRKVEGLETVNVPAGEFESFKITYITEFKGMGSRETKSVEYIAKGIGMVRSESYNKKGELDFYSVLVSYTK